MFSKKIIVTERTVIINTVSSTGVTTRTETTETKVSADPGSDATHAHNRMMDDHKKAFDSIFQQIEKMFHDIFKD